MARCKECIHYDVCKIIHFPSMFGLTGDCCDHSKNKASFIELSDEDIVYTKDKWLVLNMESEHLGKAIKRLIDCSCDKKAVC